MTADKASGPAMEDLAKLKEAAERAQGLLSRATGKRNAPQGAGERLAGFVFDGNACSTHDALSGPLFELEALSDCARAVPSLLSQLSAANARADAAEARAGRMEGATGAEAVIRNGQIVISIAVDALPMIVSGSCASGDNYLQGLWRVTDAEAFAREVCLALNHEQENGTTPVHIMFDRAFNYAIDQGAEGVEGVSEDEFEAESTRLQAQARAALREGEGG